MMVVFDLVLYLTSRHLLIAWNGLSEHYSNLFAQMLNRQNLLLLLAGVLYYTTASTGQTKCKVDSLKN